MLTSKQLIEITGISRATMNNYVARGLLPRPEVKKPEGAGERARQLGYFPDEAVDRVAEIQDLKKQGLTMDQIIARLVGGNVAAEAPAPAADVQATAVSDGGIRLTLDGLDQPAYMVNYNFLVEWSNPAATRDLFGIAGELPSEISARSLFKLMLNSAAARPWADRAGLLGFLVAVAKVRLPRQSLAVLGSDVAADDLAALEDLYDDTAPVRTGIVCESHLNLAAPEEEPRWQTVFASFYREGILFAHQSSQAPSETFLELLSRRDQLIRTVVADRKPVLTPVCTLVARLQDAVKICSELPPEEYFELINQVRQACEGVLRNNHATQGQHAGDGIVSHFFPQPDCDYRSNALHAAGQIKQVMARVSKAWQLRKKWREELHLNIGLAEGEEWFGVFNTAISVEFTVLGDTINHACGLSDFGRHGAIWATKSLIGKLSPDDRQAIRFGIYQPTADGRDQLVPSTFSRLSNLIDPTSHKHHTFHELATLAITEITEIAAHED